MTARKTVEELLPVAEVAARWRVSKNYVYDAISSGELQAVHLGTGRAKTRITASAAAEFIARRTTTKRAA